MGGDGKQARNVIAENKGNQLLQGQANIASDPRLLGIMQQYSSGKMSLQDALNATGVNHSKRRGELQKAIADMRGKLSGTRGEAISPGGAAIGALGGGMGAAIGGLFGSKDDGGRGDMEAQIRMMEQELNDLGNDEMQNRARQHQLFTDPTTGTLAASDQVKNNSLFKGVFGEGGLNDRILKEEQELASRGFSLQPEDHEAYGMASAETARMFGQEEASLAQALAARGLAAAPSGAAGAGFSGLMGNKHERLAQAQRRIADDRMKMNLERLNSARNFAMEGNKLAQAAVGDQFNRNRQGVNDYNNILKDSASAAAMEQGQENVGFQQMEATRGPTLGEAAMSTLGAAAGAGLGAMTGGIGTSVGVGLGMNHLGGVNPYATSQPAVAQTPPQPTKRR